MMKEVDINLQTKVAALLEAYPELKTKLLELSPMFAKLRSPMLRRTVAKVTSLQQAASMAGIDPPTLIQELRRLAGLAEECQEDFKEEEELAETVPDWFDRSRIKFCYDARPILEKGDSPMQEILSHAHTLLEGEILQVITPFRPTPIIDILRKRGFKIWSDGKNNYFSK